MLQATLSDSLFLDLFPFSENGFIAAKVDVGGRDVIQALVVSLVVVIFDEATDLTFQSALINMSFTVRVRVIWQMLHYAINK